MRDLSDRLLLLRGLRAAGGGPTTALILLKLLEALLPAVVAVTMALLIARVQRGGDFRPELLAFAATVLAGQLVDAFLVPVRALVKARIDGAHRAELARLTAAGPTIGVLEDPEIQDLVRLASADPMFWTEKTPGDGAMGQLNVGLPMGRRGGCRCDRGRLRLVAAPGAGAAGAGQPRHRAARHRCGSPGRGRRAPASRAASVTGRTGSCPPPRARSSASTASASSRCSARSPASRPCSDRCGADAAGTGSGLAADRRSRHGAARRRPTRSWRTAWWTARSASRWRPRCSPPRSRCTSAVERHLRRGGDRGRAAGGPGHAGVAGGAARAGGRPPRHPAGGRARRRWWSCAASGSAIPAPSGGCWTGSTWTIRPGELLAIVGLNGAGKSTLIKLLAGLYEPDAGRITADGVGHPEDRAGRPGGRRIAMVFQDFVRYHLSAAGQHRGSGQASSRSTEAALEAAVQRCRLRRRAGPAAGRAGHPAGPHAAPAVSTSPAASGSRSCSPARCTRCAPARGCWCSTNPPPTWTCAPSSRSSPGSPARRRTPASCSSRTGSPRCGTPTGSCCSTAAGSPSRARHDELMAAGGEYARMFTIQADRFSRGYDDRVEEGEL